jgi:hypothetical protein
VLVAVIIRTLEITVVLVEALHPSMEREQELVMLVHFPQQKELMVELMLAVGHFLKAVEVAEEPLLLVVMEQVLV